jgi:hypothetical protein
VPKSSTAMLTQNQPSRPNASRKASARPRSGIPERAGVAAGRRERYGAAEVGIRWERAEPRPA